MSRLYFRSEDFFSLKYNNTYNSKLTHEYFKKKGVRTLYFEVLLKSKEIMEPRISIENH